MQSFDFLRHVLIRRRLCGAIVVGLTLFADSPGVLSQQSTTKTTRPNEAVKTPQAQVRAALEDAIKRLDSGDLHGFLEYYLPVDELRQIRLQKLRTKQIADEVKQNPQQLEAIRERLVKALKSKGWVVDETESIVTIDLTKITEAEPVKPPEYVEPKLTQVAINGYGDDLNTVLSKALAVAQSRKVDELIANMFPVGALREPGFDKRQKSLAAMSKEKPDLLKPMVADLKRMQSMKPKLVDNGNTAEFLFAGTDHIPERTVKLQKVDGNWRFFDQTTAARKAIAKQQTRPLREVNVIDDTTTLRMEKLGDAWRLMPAARN